MGISRAYGIGVAAAVAACAAARPARADDPPPAPPAAGPEVEVVGQKRAASYAGLVQESATRTERVVRDVPQSVTVLPRAALDDLGARRTEDALPLVPGVQLHAGYGGTWDDYTVRGFHVWAGTTYRNGWLNGYSGASATDAVNVERIEVVRGPASATYGPALPGGTINFVTKRPLAEPRLTVSALGGSFGTWRGEIDATGPVGDAVAYRATASAETSAGYRDFNEFRRWLANPVVTVRLGPRTALLAEAQGYQIAYRADPLGVPSRGGDPLAFAVSRSFSDPGLPLARIEGVLERVEVEHALDDRWSLRASVQSKQGRYSEQTLVWGAVDPDGRTLSRALTAWHSHSRDVGVQLAVRGAFDTGPLAHALAAGVDASHEAVGYRAAASDPASAPLPIDLDAPRYGASLPAVALEGDESTWSYAVAGAWVHDLVTVLPSLKAMLGGRVDAFEQRSASAQIADRSTEVAVSPRAGLVYEPVDTLSLFAGVGRGFWPSLGVAANGGVLRPEHSVAAEVGARLAPRGDALTIDVAAFRIDNRNIAVSDPASPNFQLQLGEARSQGAEAYVTAHPTRWARLLASYAYTRAEITADPDPSRVGVALPLTARHAGGAWAQADVPVAGANVARVGVGARWVGERTLLDDSSIPAYVRVDGALGWSWRGVSATLRGENLLDARYVRGGTDRNGLLYGAPRSAFAVVGVTL